jgi:hypothetical protein
MTDASKNLATVQSDSVVPQSGEAVVARALFTATANALLKTVAGTVKKVSWTDPTLQIWTSNAALRLIQVRATTGTPNGIYDKGASTARLAISTGDLNSLKAISVNASIQLTYDENADISKTTNCTDLTYNGATSIPLIIIPIP